MSKKVSVILNCYKRPDTLNLQIAALEKQTVDPYEILIWQNKGDLADFEPIGQEMRECFSAVSNFNWGVWSRFAYALNSRGDYICIFDDDTIPGPRWLENCIAESEKQRGVYGTIGVIFHDLDYRRYQRHGWASPNEKTERTDIVGHSWFFDREMLGAFWREGQVPFHDLSGEDVHLSYAVQKYMGLNTYVPPHPKEDLSLWGSQPEDAMNFGVDNVAISVNYHGSHFGQNLKNYWDKGFDYMVLGNKNPSPPSPPPPITLNEGLKQDPINWEDVPA